MSGKEKVRVRFAPSPTGEMHPGNVRTALLNWVYAKQQGGTFVLRLEDTDVERHVEGSEQKIMEDLKWLGLDWDEGPDVGGNFGPYRQSERADIHREYARKLLEGGHVYECYCTEAELEADREQALAKGEPPRYGGRCRNLPEDKKKKKVEAGIKPTLRFRVREGELTFNDLIRSDITWELSNVGDFVIVRSNGMPAYNFTVVVDDALMEITHVIRGEGHISNTPRQILLYEALGFNPPEFAHTATILSKERKTLSKRHGAVAIRRYREEGYLPDALINYMSLLSWSSESGDDILSRDRIVEEFSFERMSSSSAAFDDDKLRWMNGQYIRMLENEELTQMAADYLEEVDFPVHDAEKTALIVSAVAGNLATVSEIVHYAEVFYREMAEPKTDEDKALVDNEDARRIFEVFLEKAGEMDNLSGEDFGVVMKLVQTETGIKGKNLWMPVRVALTGESKGPEMPSIVEIFGREKVLRRIGEALERI